MCPVCLASAAWMVGGVTTTSGLTALVVKIVRPKKGGKAAGNCNPKENGP
jgi:hypothetical protein